MGWRTSERGPLAGPLDRLEWWHYECPICQGVDFQVIAVGRVRQLHLQCVRCQAVECMHISQCQAEAQIIMLPTEDVLADYPPPPEEGGRTP